jgi:transposase
MPKKAIARRLGIDVRTVRKHLRRVSEGAGEPRRSRVPRKLDPFAEVIEAKVLQGLSAMQIYQDLSREKGFNASYPTVQRRVRELRTVEPQVYCRMRYAPGEEAQIDFAELGRLPVEGKLRKIYLFVMTLCWSRYAYYQLVTDQWVPAFLRTIRNAFEFFGGAPKRIKLDNLRSAVLIDRLGQRYYQEDFFRFAQHYGAVPDAARPATPTDKGRTERAIGYAKGNWWRSRSFTELERAAGPHSARLLHELRGGRWVFGDQLACLARLVEDYGAEAFERACERALFFGATDGAVRIQRILEGGHQRLPLPGRPAGCTNGKAQDFGRPLGEYGALLRGAEVAA